MILRLKTQNQTATIEVQSQWSIMQLITKIQEALYTDNDQYILVFHSTSGETKNNTLTKICSSSVRIRLVYQGQLLEKDSTIFDAGLVNDCCVHCMVTNVPKSRPSTNVVVPTDAD